MGEEVLKKERSGGLKSCLLLCLGLVALHFPLITLLLCALGEGDGRGDWEQINTGRRRETCKL